MWLWQKLYAFHERRLIYFMSNLWGDYKFFFKDRLKLRTKTNTPWLTSSRGNFFFSINLKQFFPFRYPNVKINALKLLYHYLCMEGILKSPLLRCMLQTIAFVVVSVIARPFIVAQCSNNTHMKYNKN